MTILLAVALAAAIQPTCSWDRPGHNPYTGDAAAAIDHYTDIPAAVRGTLKRRMAEGQSDDQVDITRDGISGKGRYDAQIRDMHFGRASVCGTVSRGKWAADRVEPAAVYCVGEHCILVPKICGNVSRISRSAPAVAAAAEKAEEEPTGVAGYSNIDLIDAPVVELDSKLDELNPEGGRKERLVSSGAGGGVPEFVVEPELDLDDLAHHYGSGNPFGFGGPGGGGGIHTAVPEADTWAMLLGGLGLVGWIARRKRARVEASAA